MLARTLWGEARGCGAVGMRHVASVILNRVRHPRWWGHDIPSVCQAPYQFSCWLRSDPNRAKLLAVTDADPMFRVALTVGAVAIAGTLEDETDGADSYYAMSMPAPPSWAERATRTFSDGWHVFCRVELPMPGTDDPNAPALSAHKYVPPRVALSADAVCVLSGVLAAAQAAIPLVFASSISRMRAFAISFRPSFGVINLLKPPSEK